MMTLEQIEQVLELKHLPAAEILETLTKQEEEATEAEFAQAYVKEYLAKNEEVDDFSFMLVRCVSLADHNRWIDMYVPKSDGVDEEALAE